MAEHLIPIKRQQAIYDNARLPSLDSVKLYLSKMDGYEKDEQLFQKEGFTPSVADKIIPLAQLRPWEIYWLFYYAKRIPESGTYLEIGSMAGGSLLCAYEATNASGASVNFIAIEHRIRGEFRNNTQSIPRLTVIASISDKAKDRINDNSVDLLFIDGDHSYEQVKKDIENYWPKVKNGGVLLGHDYGGWKYPSVVQAVNEIFSKDEFNVPKNTWMFLVRKK